MLPKAVRTSDFDFYLPPHLIAQTPAPRRDDSRLLVLNRPSGAISHRHFHDLKTLLRPADLLVLNNSKVIPARLRGAKNLTGGEIEILLIEENQRNDWWTLLKPAKRVRPGTKILFHSPKTAPIPALVLEKNPAGQCRLQFLCASNILEELPHAGEIPLPPYITRDAPRAGLAEMDLDRYQTVFAREDGSVAAPTAGLHFTPELLDGLRRLGVEIHFITLHAGLGTFAPVKTEAINEHSMHEERFFLDAPAAQAINAARAAGRRIVAVGTTTVRVLETAALQQEGELAAQSGRTRIFIHPPWRFRVVDALITNFHLPRSTLLMLVSAFAAPGELSGRARILAAYQEAIQQNYRFFSYGDAMFIQ